MLIDCDTCPAHPTGCADCVVPVLLGAPPGRQSTDLLIVPLGSRRGRGLTAEDVVVRPAGVVLEFDEVERRAVRVLADAGLVPPLRHQRPVRPAGARGAAPQRWAGGQGVGRRTG